MGRTGTQPVGTPGRNRRGYALLSVCAGSAAVLSAALMLLAADPSQRGKSKATAKGPADVYVTTYAPLIKKYCGSCHGKAATAGLDLTIYKNTASVVKGRSSWEKTAEYLGSGH